MIKSLKQTVQGLKASRQGRVDSSLVVAEALQRLDQLQELWNVLEPTGVPPSVEDLPWTSEECYDFLAAYGIVWRSRLGHGLDNALSETQAIVRSRWYRRGEPPLSEARPWRTNYGKGTPVGREIACLFDLSLFSRAWGPTTQGTPADREISWLELAREFHPVLTWAGQTFRTYGALLAAYAVHVPDPTSWLTEAERLRQASELADLDLTKEDIQRVLQEVSEALQQLDEAELVAALCRILQEHLPQSAWQVSDTDSILASFPETLAELENGLNQALGWLNEHPETFQLASAFIQMVVSGCREDLENWPDLEITAWKFQTLVQMLHAAETIAPRSTHWVIQVLKEYVRQVALPIGLAATTTRLVASDTKRMLPALTFPRELLQPILAAASGESSTPQVLRWGSPDQHYVAALILSGCRAVLNVYQRASGERARELAGQPVRIAGIAAQLDTQGSAQLNVWEMYRTGEAIYLQVGPQRIQWIPITEPSQPMSQSIS
ncbi:MAG: hypothetical protein RMJ82_09755 [Gemmatales bacterium]|nr:hypothetical protein [Gemmatales bacterium]